MIAENAINHPSLVDRVVEHVFRRIMSGELEPGQKVTEDQIASEFGVSRTPVREAVKRLAELGLIVVRPRSGLEVVSVGEQDVKDIRELRRELEAFALRQAVPRMTDEDVAGLGAIQENCEGLLEEGNRLAVFREDSRLHLAIAALSGNRHLEETLQRLDVKVQLCRMFLCQSDAKIGANVRFHRRVLAAIRDKDIEKAEALLREHINGMSL